MLALLLAPLLALPRAAGAVDVAPPAPIEVRSPTPVELGALAAEVSLPRLLETQAGREVLGQSAQPARSPIPIHVEAPDPRLYRVQPGQAAVYDNIQNAVYMNRRLLGLSEPQLAQARHDETLRQRVADALDATILHELKHWKTRQETGDIALKENEIEAYHTEARYMLERLDTDPDYLKRLPPLTAQRKIPLLQAWLKGPEHLARHVYDRYPQTPALLQADPAREVAKLDEELARWRGRRDHYDEHKRELERMTKLARSMDGVGERLNAGPPRWKQLQRMLDEFQTPQAVADVIAQLEDARAFWTSDGRREKATAYYAAMWQRVHADWTAWRQARPDYALPLPPKPPTAWQILSARLRTAMIFPWRKTRS